MILLLIILFDYERGIFFAIIPVLILLSCQSTTDANSYNHYFVEKERKIGSYTDAAISKFNVYYSTDNYDSLAIVSEQVEKIITDELYDMGLKKIPEEIIGGEELKRAFISYFSYMKSVFTAYKELGLQENADKREAARARLSILIERNDSEIKAMQKAQRKFAYDNNLRMK